MRKTLSFMIILCLLFCLCGCGVNYESTVTVNEPADNSVNGYRLEHKELEDSKQSTSGDAQVQLPSNAVYYANTNSKKFHLSTCGTAKRIGEENLYTTSTRAELINSGYSPCKSCNP